MLKTAMITAMIAIAALGATAEAKPRNRVDDYFAERGKVYCVKAVYRDGMPYYRLAPCPRRGR